MSSRGRMDEGLRITVGNDVYYQKANNSPRTKSRSPSGDLRNRLGPRPNMGSRMMDERREGYPPERVQQGYPPDPRQWQNDQYKHQWHPEDRSYSGRMPEDQYRSEGGRSMERMRSPNQGKSRYPAEQPSKYFDSPGRQYKRSPQRGRSPPPQRRGHSPPYDYNDPVRAPQSPRNYLRRSISPREKARYRSSSDSSGSRSRSSSRHSGKRRSQKNTAPADDFLMTMYSGSGPAPNNERGYLHSSLDRSSKVDKKSYRRDERELNSRGYINPDRDGHSLNALSQAYGNTPPKRHHSETMDDEDRFLYGDGPPVQKNSSKGGEPTKKSILKRRTKSPDPEPLQKMSQEEAANVTPGGFDNNALKNVLKAIGFDFELSKQIQEKAAKENPDEIAPTPKETKKEKKTAAKKQDKAPVVNIQQQQQQQQQQQIQPSVTMASYQPNNPPMQMPYQIQGAHQIQGAQYITPQVLQQGQAAGGVYIYQPQVSGPPQLVYQQHPIAGKTVIQPQQTHPNLKVIQPVEQPKVKVDPKTAEEERRARKQRLKFLEVELEKLKRQQLELVRKKKRQAVTAGDQELMRQNSLLQAGVEKQINEIRLAAERAAGAESSTDSSDSDDSDDSSEDDAPKYQYIDPGKHTCRICNEHTGKLLEFLGHLHSKNHKKEMDPSDKPWMKKIAQKNKKKNPYSIPVPLKGAEFLMPVLSYYCKICKEHFSDEFKAEDHCHGIEHNEKYKKFCQDHPKYEKAYDVDQAAQKIKKLKEEVAIGRDLHHDHTPKLKVERVSLERPQVRSPYERVKEEKHAPVSTPPPPKRSYRERTPPKRYESYKKPSPERKHAPKRRFEESHDLRVTEEKKSTRHGGRWSPGYNDYEGNDEKMSRSSYDRKEDLSKSTRNSRSSSSKAGYGGGSKSPGIGFSKFTWKKTDKKESPEMPKKKEAPTPPPLTPTTTPKEKPALKNKSEDIEKGKFAAKLTGKASTISPKLNTGSKLVKRSGFGVSTPNTQIRSGIKGLPLKSPITPKTTPTPPMNAVLAASTRSLPPSRPLGIMKAGAVIKKAPEVVKPPPPPPVEPEPEAKTIIRNEPPPPGTVDVFDATDAGNESDASGISMELASDED